MGSTPSAVFGDPFGLSSSALGFGEAGLGVQLRGSGHVLEQGLQSLRRSLSHAGRQPPIGHADAQAGEAFPPGEGGIAPRLQDGGLGGGLNMRHGSRDRRHSSRAEQPQAMFRQRAMTLSHAPDARHMDGALFGMVCEAFKPPGTGGRLVCSSTTRPMIDRVQGAPES